jgi:hypothetical protein
VNFSLQNEAVSRPPLPDNAPPFDHKNTTPAIGFPQKPLQKRHSTTAKKSGQNRFENDAA